ncbi:hypothetical protein J3P78_11285 [Pseudomonas sp. R4-79]
MDTTFNRSGYAEVCYMGQDVYPSSLSIIKGERIVVSAFTIEESTHYGLLVGYNLDGTLDESFADKGYALLGAPTYKRSEVWDLQQTQGGLLLAIGRGISEESHRGGFLTRLHENGRADPTFNLGKPIFTPAGLLDELMAGAVQADGKIILAGSKFHETGGALVRYDPDGSPDISFGNAGITHFPSVGDARLVKLQQDGLILAGGAVSPDGSRVAAVLRYHP